MRNAIPGEQLTPGTHQWQWGGRDDADARLSAGTYFAKLRVPAELRATKAVKLH